MAIDQSFIGALSVTQARDFRRHWYAMGITAGVTNIFSLAVSQRGSGANMSVDVSAGTAVILGTETNLALDMMPFRSDATQNVPISTANPSNPRIDVIVARWQDVEGSGATNSKTIAVVIGTPAASPAVPALPANSIPLAQVRVNAAATSIVNANITDRRFVSMMPGALVGGLTITGSSTALGGLHDVAGAAMTFYMPTLTLGRFVHVKLDVPYVITATGPASHDAVDITLCDSSNNILGLRRIISHGFLGGGYNDGCTVEAWIANATLPAGLQTVKARVYCPTASTGLGGFTGRLHLTAVYH